MRTQIETLLARERTRAVRCWRSWCKIELAKSVHCKALAGPVSTVPALNAVWNSARLPHPERQGRSRNRGRSRPGLDVGCACLEPADVAILLQLLKSPDRLGVSSIIGADLYARCPRPAAARSARTAESKRHR